MATTAQENALKAIINGARNGGDAMQKCEAYCTQNNINTSIYTNSNTSIGRLLNDKWFPSGRGTVNTGGSSGGVTTTPTTESEGFLSNLKGKMASFAEGFNKPFQILFEQINDVVDKSVGQYTSIDNDPALRKIFDIISKGPISREAGIGALKLLKNEILDQYQQENRLLDQINSKTSLTGDLSRNLQEDIKRASVSAAEFGFTMEDIGDMFVQLVSDSGRFGLINEQTMSKAAPTARALGVSMYELGATIGTFEKVGIGANKTLETVGKTLTRSNALGLSGKQIVKDLETNLEKLNKYGFQNGVQGLERMIQRSKELRMNLDSAFKIADDVMDPDKALALSANLQVLGGAIGDFNDPLKLMYMATNNVEGLQEALGEAAKTLATYNSEQGRFEISGINLRRAKAMADELGISYEELTKGAIAAAERTSALAEIGARGLKFDKKEDKEFLTNLARMEGGEMVISIPKSLADKLGGDIAKTQKVALSQIDQKTADALLENREQMEEMSVEEISRQQLSFIQQMTRDMAVVAQYYRYQAVKEIGESNIVKFLKESGAMPKVESAKESALEGLKKTEYNPATGGKGFIEAIKSDLMNMLGGVFTSENTNNATNTQERTVNVNRNVTVNFRSDSQLDYLSRHAQLNPSAWTSATEDGEFLDGETRTT